MCLSRLFLAAALTFSVSCAEPPCSSDADCAGYEQAVCQEGACVCEFDELGRCFCEEQRRCDEVYGDGSRVCSSGVCAECDDDDDCGRLGRCDATGTCEALECLVDEDCPGAYCNVEANDCYACRGDDDCPDGYGCRDDGACVACESDGQCADGELCDADFLFNGTEVVGTNRCGEACGPTCRPECAGDPDCLQRPECVVDNPECLGEICTTWDDCAELPDDCELRLQQCSNGAACEAIGRSFIEPIYYLCLPTPCLFDFECADTEVCYEGACLPGCDLGTSCPEGGECTARVHFDRGACLGG